MRWLVHNFWIKILAVLMAFLLWFHVATEREYEVDIRYQLEYENLADDLVLATPPPKNATVRCVGSGKNIIPIIFRDRAWTIDLSREQEGQRKISLLARNAPNFDIQGLDFSFVSRGGEIVLDVDRLAQKAVPINAVVTFEPKAGYIRVGQVEIVPDTVLLTGPASAVAGISSVETRSTTFDNLTGHVDDEIELAPMNIFNVNRDFDKCRIYADVQPLAEKTFVGIPIRANGFTESDSLLIDPANVTVTLGGGRRVLEELDTTLIQVHLDSLMTDTLVSDTGSSFVRVFVEVPPVVRDVSVSPDSVFVRLR